MMQCPNCNESIRPEDEFCENCGLNLRQNQSRPQADHKSGFQLPFAIGSWKTIKWLVVIAIGSLLLGIACCVSTSIFLQRFREPQIAVTVVKEKVVVTATSTPTPTNTPGPSPTPTQTGTPTPTSTPSPTPTPIPTTVPGTALTPGETWYKDGLALWMDVAAMSPGNLAIDLILKNLGDEFLIVDLGQIRMVSNLGESSILHAGNLPKGISLEPGEQFVITEGGFFPYNLANKDVAYVFVEVVGMSRIEKAQWRVDIPH